MEFIHETEWHKANVKCPLCNLPASEGEHQIWLEWDTKAPTLGCRVPMLVMNPKRLGIVTL